MALSPVTAIAINGLGKNLGLSNSHITSLSNTDNPMYEYVNVGLVAKAQQAIADANKPNLAASSLPGLTGVVPATYSATITPAGNLAAAIATRAGAILDTTDLSGFAQFFSVVVGYASQMVKLFKDTNNLSVTEIENYGADIKGLSDIATSGLIGLVAPRDAETLANLAADLQDLGRIFDFQDLELLGTARGLIKQISATNLAENIKIVAEFQKIGITRVDYTDANIESICNNICRSITVSREFQTAFNSNLDTTQVKNLAEILVPGKCLSRSKGSVTFTDFVELGDKFTVFPRLAIKSSKELGDLLAKIGTTGELAELDAVDSVISTDDIDDLKDNYGYGSGPYGNPTVIDLIGSAGGVGLKELFNECAVAARYIETTSYGIALDGFYDDIIAAAAEDPIDTATINARVSSINSTISSLLADNDTEVAAQVQILNTKYAQIAKKISDELELSSKAGLDVSSFAANNKNALLSFASNLENFGADSDKIGTKTLIDALTSADVYGQAIRTSLQTGANQSALKAQGLIPKVMI